MDNFRLKFVEEATDLINALESSILSLENDVTNTELINGVFRIMHSLKGGGAMFGFDMISNFTHNMENIYDKIRTNQVKITRELLSITLASVDHLRNLLDDDASKDKTIVAQDKELTFRLLKEINQSGLSFGDNKGAEIKVQPEISEKVSTEKVFYIYFKPNSDIFNNGTNPIYLVDDLNALGKCIIYSGISDIPNFKEYNANECYTYWEIFLQTSYNESEIEENFAFVEDDCILEINKLSDDSVLDDENFITLISSINEKKEKRFDPNNIIERLSDLQEVKAEEKELIDVHDKIKKFSKETVITSVRVDSEKIDEFMNLVSELVTAQARLKLISEKLLNVDLNMVVEVFDNISTQLRDNALGMSLIPIENIIVRFRRLVRDLSGEFGKNINFITQGTDTELDKSMVQALTEPLMHIVRNSIDHGIETEKERIKLGKPAQGTITLKAFYSGSSVHVVAEDDGRGIDIVKIKKKAIEKGFIREDQKISDHEALNLIFLPGFSTAEKVTDISGRGVGMDVLKKKISEIRGEIELKSKVGYGTTIIIKLPLTLSIIDGLLVKINNDSYILPLSAIARIHELKITELEGLYNSIIVLKGEQIPFYILRDELQLEGKNPSEIQFIAVKYESRKIGLIFDEIIGECQAVVKPLGKLYRNHEIVSGATILGDGTVALVLDVNKIIEKLSAK